MVVFQALTWETRDTDDEHLISIFGKTSEGKSVCLTTAFTPYFFVKLPRNITQQKVQIIYNKIEKACTNLIWTRHFDSCTELVFSQLDGSIQVIYVQLRITRTLT